MSSSEGEEQHRAPWFTQQEVEVIMSSVLEHWTQLYGTRTPYATARQKKAIWSQMAEACSQISDFKRHWKSIHKREYQGLSDVLSLASSPGRVERMRPTANPHLRQLTTSRLLRHRSSLGTEPLIPTPPKLSPPRSDIAQELICCICLDFFRKPVLLQCGHSFCRICIDTHSRYKLICPCPVCRTAFHKGKYTVVAALDSLAEKVRGSPIWSKRKELIDPRGQCRNHKEKLKLFCKDDGCLVCLVCRDAPQHKDHRFLPIQDAVSVLKDELQAILLPLKETLKKSMARKANQEQAVLTQKRERFISKNSVATMFRKFRHSLMTHEIELLKEVTTRAESAPKEMDSLRQECQMVRETLQSTQNQLDEDDPIVFLKGVKSCLEHCSTEHHVGDPAAELSSALFKLGSGSPIEHIIWKRLKSSLCLGKNPAPSRLTLDPDTAHYDLVLSEDQTSVWYRGTNRWPPHHCKRFIRAPAVLASEGFTSGKHYWEVHVGRASSWVVGMVEESINREANVKPVPWEGVWVMDWRKFESLANLHAGEACSDLPVISRPQKIGVYLDFDNAVVSFYNAANMSHVQTIRFLTKSKLFPYFCLCADGPVEKYEPLTLY